MSWIQKFLIIFFLIIIPVIIIVCIGYFAGKNDLTSNENILSNVLMILFSILASTTVAHFYFEASNKRSLGVYAKKAAEKVSNLSAQLSKLSVYLQEEMDEALSPEQANLVMQARVKSAIHIVETLRSVNERSLSDWRGVVPEDQIEEAEQNIEEQEGMFRSVVNEYRNLYRPSEYHIESSDEDLMHNLEDINKRIDNLATSIIGTPITKKGKLPKREKIKLNCPDCGAENEYRQRPLPSSIKKFKCSGCTSKLISRWDDQHGFSLYLQDSLIMTHNSELDEEIVQKVKKLLPPQPWPKGVAKEIGEEIGLSNSMMSRITDELIKRGDFKVQIDGVLYEPAAEAESSVKNKSAKSSKKTKNK